MLKKLRHVGIMVDDFDRAIEKFKGLGIDCTETAENTNIDLRVGFLPIGDSALELLYHSHPDKGDDSCPPWCAGRRGPSIISVSRWMISKALFPLSNAMERS